MSAYPKVSITMKGYLCVLAISASMILTGCIAGVAPIVGVPVGAEETALELRFKGSTADRKASWEIYEREIHHTYSLLFSPEGPRAKMALRSDYCYLLKRQDSPLVELRFLKLRAPYALTANHFDQIHFIPDMECWVAHCLCPGEAHDLSSLSFLASAEELSRMERETAKHRIVVFNEAQIIREQIVCASVTKPAFSYQGNKKVVRYRTPSGWRNYSVVRGDDFAEQAGAR